MQLSHSQIPWEIYCIYITYIAYIYQTRNILWIYCYNIVNILLWHISLYILCNVKSWPCKQLSPQTKPRGRLCTTSHQSSIAMNLSYPAWVSQYIMTRIIVLSSCRPIIWYNDMCFRNKWSEEAGFTTTLASFEATSGIYNCPQLCAKKQ